MRPCLGQREHAGGTATTICVANFKRVQMSVLVEVTGQVRRQLRSEDVRDLRPAWLDVIAYAPALADKRRPVLRLIPT